MIGPLTAGFLPVATSMPGTGVLTIGNDNT